MPESLWKNVKWAKKKKCQIISLYRLQTWQKEKQMQKRKGWREINPKETVDMIQWLQRTGFLLKTRARDAQAAQVHPCQIETGEGTGWTSRQFGKIKFLLILAVISYHIKNKIEWWAEESSVQDHIEKKGSHLLWMIHSSCISTHATRPHAMVPGSWRGTVPHWTKYRRRLLWGQRNDL